MNDHSGATGDSQLAKGSRLLLAAYLAHLAVPLFLVADITFAWHQGYVTYDAKKATGWVQGISILWLVLGLGVFVLARYRPQLLERLKRPLLSLYAVYFALVVAETVIRVLMPAPEGPALWQPGSKWVTKVDPAAYAGISGNKTFSVNDVGLRGPSFSRQDGVYKIVAVGGSTTICDKLDDSEEWPHVLMQTLNRRQGRTPAWVGNAGVSGHTTVHHLVLLKTLPIFQKIDMIVLLIGVNDLAATMAYDGSPTQPDLEADATRFRQLILRGGRGLPLPLFRRLRVVKLARNLVVSVGLLLKPSHWQELQMDKFRKMRAAGPIVPLPDLQNGLTEYRSRISTLAWECRDLGVRCLFLTQPSLWRTDLSPGEQQLIMGGPVGRWWKRRGYASIEDLTRAMAAYNRVLLEVCQEKQLECYDLASVIPQNSSVFYDDVHYNENGARVVASRLADYLLVREPFNQGGAKFEKGRSTGGSD